MKPPIPGRRSAPRRLVALLAASLSAWTAFLHTGCEGGSTGVDNPGLVELRVEFRDAAGGPVPVRGGLEVYERESNPAVDSSPLMRLEMEDEAGLTLTSGDFDRVLAARPPKKSAGTKRSAGAAPPPPPSDTVRFNLVLRGAAGSGAVAAGLAYNRARKRFTLEGAGEAGVRMLPRPLIRFAASLRRAPGQAGPGRVFLPGTPFQATLVDSVFALEGIPEGRFPMRLLDGDGYVYAVRESLDTHAGGKFTAAPEPLGRIPAVDAPPGFAVEAQPPPAVNAGQDAPLNARLLGADPNDSRISFRWRFLEKAPDDSARIDDPTRLRTVLKQPAGQGYSLEIAATLGMATVRDTLILKVGPTPPPPPQPQAKFASPKTGDSVVQGQPYKVVWDHPAPGLVRLEASYKEVDDGAWSLIADSLVQTAGQNAYAWTPPVLGNASYNAFLRLKAIPSDSVIGTMPGAFNLLPPP